jgi:hypothetical protein
MLCSIPSPHFVFRMGDCIPGPSWPKIHSIDNECIFAFVRMSARIIEGEYCDVAWGPEGRRQRTEATKPEREEQQRRRAAVVPRNGSEAASEDMEVLIRCDSIVCQQSNRCCASRKRGKERRDTVVLVVLCCGSTTSDVGNPRWTLRKQKKGKALLKISMASFACITIFSAFHHPSSLRI